MSTNSTQSVASRSPSDRSPSNDPSSRADLPQVTEWILQGKLDEAGEHCRKLLSQNPDLASVWHLSGVIHSQQGNLPAAVEAFRQAVRLSPAESDYLKNLGEALLTAGDFPGAILAIEQALRIEPLHAGLWTTLSESLLHLGEQSAAFDCLKQALQLQPGLPAARILLGNIQKQMGDLESAAENYRFVFEQDPQNIVAAVNLASALRAQGDTRTALEILRNLKHAGKDSPHIAYNLANTLVDLGEFGEARSHFEQALQTHPQPAKVLFNLSSIMKFRDEDRPRLERWATASRNAAKTSDDFAYFHFALGKAHDDLAEYETAFDHYQRGNSLVSTTFDPALHHREINSTISQWTQQFAESRSAWGNATSAPVFIVGMPRSGTTLVEQVLAAHSQVLPLGERELTGRLLAEHADSIGCAGDLALAASRSTQADYYGLTEHLLRDVPLSQPKTRFTDKMPTNFLLLGWIATLFPEATLIHCVRDPRDVCLSCYFQHFTARLPFTYSLEHLTAYYRDYQRLMQHWHAVFPGRILDVNYENLVESPEGQVRQIVDHVGLEWEPDCLQSHAVDRAVRTASGWQVRQPIYQSSRQRWTRYREWIGPLLKEFGDQTHPLPPG